jgi:hypothetical protein
MTTPWSLPAGGVTRNSPWTNSNLPSGVGYVMNSAIVMNRGGIRAGCARVAPIRNGSPQDTLGGTESAIGHAGWCTADISPASWINRIPTESSRRSETLPSTADPRRVSPKLLNTVVHRIGRQIQLAGSRHRASVDVHLVKDVHVAQTREYAGIIGENQA